MNATIVVIGRNEAQRLTACFKSVGSHRVIYVDSASTDESVAIALSHNAHVIELDLARPFSAARARNEGFDMAMQINPNTRYIQFVDGDCVMVEGWIEDAVKFLDENPQCAAVAGRLRERFPDESIYNRLCDLEWNTPVGDVDACGGIGMYRTSALEQVGRFNDTVVAGEEPELCLRLRKEGWTIHRMDIEMALHDAAMTHFRQWWRRAVRGGYGALDIATRFERNGYSDAFSKQVRSARVWALGWAILLAIAMVFVISSQGSTVSLFTLAFVFSIPPVQMIRIAVKALPKCGKFKTSLAYGFLMMVEKWANLTGQIRYIRDRRAGRNLSVIEHKSVCSQTSGIKKG